LGKKGEMDVTDTAKQKRGRGEEKKIINWF
jgi:hypothetical protein